MTLLTAAQIAKRLGILQEMMKRDATLPSIDDLKAPLMLLAHMDAAGMKGLHAHLMKTRRRAIPFQLNGRTFLLPRKVAIVIVTTEIKVRSTKN